MKMGFWVKAGKGGAYIDKSPGSIFSSAALLIGFWALMLLFVAPGLGLIFLLIAFILSAFRYNEKKNFLRKEYKAKYGYIKQGEFTQPSHSTPMKSPNPTIRNHTTI